MKKWWMAAALAAICVGQSARGQHPPDGGGPLPDPAPVAPSGPPGGDYRYTPGPLTGSMAPPGPEDKLSLPGDVPTAWGRGPSPESGVYFSIGGQSLMRQRPGRAVVAGDDRVLIYGIPKPILETSDIDPKFDTGGRVTLGYLCDDAAIELTGFYLPQQESNASITDKGHVGVPFRTPPGPFSGFFDQGIWNQATSATVGLQTALGDAELNYRWWSRSQTGVEGIVGFRYMELQERATISVDDTNLAPLIGGGPNQAFASTYMARAQNHLLMAQTGFEWDLPLAKWLSFGVMAKAAFGADDVEVTTRLTNAVGLVGVQGRHSEWTYASVYEFNMFLDIVQFEKMRLRVGYTAMWALHVAEGFTQVTYDLGTQPGSRKDGGSIFYQGPMVELQFLF